MVYTLLEKALKRATNYLMLLSL